MNKTEAIHEASSWLSKNKGFVGVVMGFGSVVLAIMSATYWASSVVNSFDKRTTVSELRLTILEDMNKELQDDVDAIKDEQLRRANSSIDEFNKYLRRIENKLDGE